MADAQQQIADDVASMTNNDTTNVDDTEMKDAPATDIVDNAPTTISDVEENSNTLVTSTSTAAIVTHVEEDTEQQDAADKPIVDQAPPIITTDDQNAAPIADTDTITTATDEQQLPDATPLATPKKKAGRKKKAAPKAATTPASSKKRKTETNNNKQETPQDTEQPMQKTQTATTPEEEQQKQRSRSTRVIRPPSRYTDEEENNNTAPANTTSVPTTTSSSNNNSSLASPKPNKTAPPSDDNEAKPNTEEETSKASTENKSPRIARKRGKKRKRQNLEKEEKKDATPVQDEEDDVVMTDEQAPAATTTTTTTLAEEESNNNKSEKKRTLRVINPAKRRRFQTRLSGLTPATKSKASSMHSTDLLHVFAYLDGKTLGQCMRVCHAWKNAAQSNSLWRTLYDQKWSIHFGNLIKYTGTLEWRKLYKARSRILLLPLIEQAEYMCKFYMIENNPKILDVILDRVENEVTLWTTGQKQKAIEQAAASTLTNATQPDQGKKRKLIRQLSHALMRINEIEHVAEQ